MNKKVYKNKTITLAISAMFSALLVGGKQLLAGLPNIEVVTLLIALCAYAWGLKTALFATNVFILCDMAIWGINTWVISYAVHFNLVAVIFWLLSFVKAKGAMRVVLPTAVAVVLTAMFGVLTSAVDTLIGFSGGFFVVAQDFWRRFAVVYSAGIYFYVVQVASNLVLFATAFVPLVKVNQKVQQKLLANTLAEQNNPIQRK